MTTAQAIFRHIANLQHELAQLMDLVANLEPAERPVAGVPATPPAPAVSEQATPAAEAVVETAQEAPTKRRRWSYLPGTFYRIVGPNPFRNGNNYNLFEFLESGFGRSAFGQEQVVAAMQHLKATGHFDSVQDEGQSVLFFLRNAGAVKGAMEMTPAPAMGAMSVDFASLPAPVDPFDKRWKLAGSTPFRAGINGAIWDHLGDRSFTRRELEDEVRALALDGRLDSARDPEIIARDFFMRVEEREAIARA